MHTLDQLHSLHLHSQPRHLHLHLNRLYSQSHWTKDIENVITLSKLIIPIDHDNRCFTSHHVEFKNR